MGLERFYRHTATYTVGNLVYRGAAFLLVPLYARALTPAEYGKLELITLTAFILQSFCAAGMAHSTLRYYFEGDSEKERRTLVSTALIGSLAFAGAFGLLFVITAPFISQLVFKTSAYALAFRLVAVSLVLEISREINLAYVRARERSRLFIVIAFVQLLTQVSTTLFTVVVLELGIVGVLLGNLTATVLVWALLTISTLRECGLHFDWHRLAQVARYGAPLMLSELVGTSSQSLDRWALNAYATLDAIGVYALGMRIANIIPILITGPFTKSYGPYRFSVMQQPDAHRIYARVQTYYLFASCFVVVMIGSLSRELLRLLAAPEYWSAATVVPLLLIPAGLSGVDYCFQTGIYISKKTHYMFYASLMRSAVTLGLVFLLVPRIGIMGAALASIGATLYGLTQTWVISCRLYPMKFEFGRMFRIVAAGAIVVLAALSIHVESLWHALVLKTALVAMFPFVVGLLGVYTAEEIAIAKTLWIRCRATFTVGGAAVRMDLAGIFASEGNRTSPAAPVDGESRVTTALPRVSVCLPVYNGGRYLEHALKALLEQTCSEFEIIVSDNASTDDTAAICAKYVRLDPRVKYFRNETNIGLSGNLVRAVQLASAPYVKVASADDLCSPNLVAECLAVLERHPDTVLCYGTTFLVDDEGRVTGRYDDGLDLPISDAVTRYRRAIERIRRVNVVYGVMRTDVAKRVVSQLRSFDGSDLVLVAELILYGKFRHTPAASFYRRIHAAAASALKDPEKQRYIDPLKKRFLPVYLWRIHYGHLRALRRSPLSLRDKCRAAGAVIACAIQNRAEFIEELSKVLREVLRPLSRRARHHASHSA